MNTSLIGWAALAIIVFCIKAYLKKNKSYRREYSLGLKIAEEIQALVLKDSFNKAEDLLKNQEANDITQIIDHLALSVKKEQLLAWEASENSDFSKLTLGVFYLHEAWIVRSHKLADEVSDDKAESFFDYLNLSETTLDLIPENSICNAEVNSRRVRLYMSLSDKETATEYFKKSSQNHPDLIFSYIHYAELIQPKWGGTIEEVEIFYESLPNKFLVKSIVQLKLILDAIVIDDNYFTKYNEDLNDFAIQKVLEIDEKLASINLTSIHRFVLFNYMEAISNNLGRKDIRKKYVSLMEGNYTIYPYGLIA